MNANEYFCKIFKYIDFVFCHSLSSLAYLLNIHIEVSALFLPLHQSNQIGQ